MRRTLLAAFALLLLAAAPASAAECRNLALASNGGVASVSSVYNDYPTDTLNNGRREDRWGVYYWQGRNWISPDWAQIEWASAQTLDRIVVRGVVEWGTSSYYADRANRRYRAVTVQYWDAARSAWVDVVGRPGQDNPVTDWVNPWLAGDGSEYRQFDVTPITTSKIRVLIESGVDYTKLDEIEAYGSGGDCDPSPGICTNRAVDGTVTASSTHASGLYPLSGVTNGQRESGATKGYWNDGTNGVWPDWVQAEWARAIDVDRIVVRIPLAGTGFPVGEITLRRTRVQYWDASTSAWADVVGATGQPNPILDWTGPIGRADGSETKTFDLAAPVRTTRVRVLIEEGSTDGWSWLDELEVYSADCVVTPRDVNLAPSGTPSGNESLNLSVINDGRRQALDGSGVWQDYTYYAGDDWAAINWSAPRSLNRIVVRGPWLSQAYAPTYRTLGKVRVQYWDGAIPKWRDVSSSQPNPVIDWVLPHLATDGSEIRQFDFPTVTTTRVRVFFEEGISYRYSYLEELEAYWVS